MKKYRVKVNGKLYEVELESIEISEEKVELKPDDEKKEVVTNGEFKTINAPIGGKVLDVKVSVNQQVKKGDLICIIEAMKLENEVLSSVSGKVKEVRVSVGNQVANKEVLVVVE